MDDGQGEGQRNGNGDAQKPRDLRKRSTGDLREKLSEAGRKGGRPPTRFRYREKIKRIEQQVRERGKIELVPLAIQVCRDMLRGRIACSAEVRAGLVKDVLDRFGFPKHTEISAEIDIGIKHVELSGYRDNKGVWHDVPWDEVEAAQVVDEAPQQLPPADDAPGTNGHGG